MNKYVSGCIGVEIPLTATKSKIYFQFIDQLKGKRIKHVDFCTSTIVDKCPSGLSNIAAGVEKNIFITLVEQNTQLQLIQDLPATALTTLDDRMYINKLIDLQRSFVDLSKCNVNDITGKSIYLVFWFDNSNIWEVIPQKNNRTSVNFLELKLTGKKTFFAENIDLYKKRFQNILLSFPTFTPAGNGGIESAYAKNKFLTLRSGTEEFFKQVPLLLFDQSKTTNRLRLQNIKFDMQTSYIETAGVTANDLKTVFFNCILDCNR